ncbi:MAG TPA: DUF6531 domain-containing protein [Actinospica sp.]|nr:DUF6531 domain-containing protein [Actinospica sp.]
MTAAVVAAGLICAQPPAEAAAAASPKAPVATAPSAADFGARASSSADLAVDGFGDGTGYHIQVATERTGFAWRQKALLKPAGLDDSSWTGYQCTSGDGRFEAVAVLPGSAVDSTAAREHGAFAYSVDLATGTVRPIASGVSLAYYSPGCGTGDEAEFTVELGSDEQSTQLLAANLATGAVDHATSVSGQLTSAVPTSSGVVAVQGGYLVRVPEAGAQAGHPARLAKADGQAYDLRPAADGGIDYLTLAPGSGTARLEHERAGHVTVLGSGATAKLGLFQGRRGRNTVIGAGSVTSGSTLRAVATGALADPAYASLDGDAVFGDKQAADKPDPSVLSVPTGRVVSRPADPAATAPDTAVSRWVPAGIDSAASSAPNFPVPAPAAPSTKAKAGTALPATAQTPSCSVPRNNPQFQALQPSNAQVDWAVQMAEQNLLTSANLTRPANYQNMGLVAYSPNSDFAEVPLDHPAGDSWSTVPRSVYEAILAQESNWDQASWHALPGIDGNPLIADYYGSAGTITSIDYAAADCGYGIGQVTTGMFASQTGQQYSAHGQEKIAVDYAENIAAGLQILERIWNQLYTDGVLVNGGDPRYLENWYYAIWAYNTGIEPDAAHGNTSGCTPGPSCTGPDGTWGLGWANNPANPNYPPDRNPYLAYTYADAAHPGDWPYQERVLGWMGTPLERSGTKAYAGATYNGGENWLTPAPFTTFCTTSGNDCTPGANAGTCTLADSECWWHASVTWMPNCSTDCSTSGYTISGGGEPAGSDPHPPVCSLDTTQVPSSAIIVSAQVGLAVGARPVNDAGCGSANWSNNGSFTMAYGADSNGNPVGAIDTHQLGVGFGGYILFTHTEDSSNPEIVNTGTWTPNLPSSQYYLVMAHIPATGARAADALYTINPGGSVAPIGVRINQDVGFDAWVPLATVAMANGGSVKLSNVSAMNGTYDVGYDAVAFVPEGGTPGVALGGPPTTAQQPGGSNPANKNCTCGSILTGDPVNTANGYYSENATDLSTPGRGIPLSFGRVYNSAVADPQGPNGSLAVNGPFGYGWSSSYGLSAATDPSTGNVTVTQEDGSQVAFTDTSGTYTVAAPRFFATLTKSGSTYTYTRTGKEVFTFDTASGHLLSETDLAGAHASTPYATKLAYNGSGQLSTITDPAGHVYTIGWTGGHITSVTDSAGREVSYGYDSAGDLTDVYGLATVRSPSLQSNDRTTYTYNTTTHLLTGMRQPKYYGDTTTKPTPAMSMVYDGSERVTSQTDATGHTMMFNYGPSTSPSLTAGQTLVTDASGHETLYTYQNGLLVSQTKGYGSASPSTTAYTYDPLTLGISSETDPNGHLETFTYDRNGDKTSQSNGLGFATTYTYDALGDLTSKVDPLGVSATYTYDAYGDLTGRTTAQLQQSAEIFDANPGAMPSRATSYYYDDTAHPADRTRTVDARGFTTTTSYDAYGDVASVADPMGDVTKYGYNTGTGWRTSQVSGNGVAAGTAPGCTPPAVGCTTYAYDAYGRVIQVTDPLGHATKRTYDANGNLLSATDGDQNTTTYGYDASNRRTSVTNPDTTASHTDYNPDGTTADTIDGAGNKTTYTYDAQGRTLTQVDPDSRTTSYTYDGNGNVLTVTNPAKQVITDGYDAANELTSAKYSDGTTPNIAYVYNEDGLKTSMTDGTGTTSWSYDAFGEVVSETNGYGSTVGYGYDNDGDATSIVYPGGSTQTVTQAYDKADRLTTVTDWSSNATGFGYDNDNNLTSTTYPDGVKVTGSFDNSDNLSAVAAADGSTAVASVQYTHDNADQIATSTPTALPGSAQTYGYTTLEQLKSAASGSTSTSYVYNGAGQATSQTGAAQAFDAAGQLCWKLPGTATSSAGCTAPPTGATTYTYNSRGDRTAANPSGGTASTYAYNQANELTGYTGIGGSATYAYDGQGLRAAKTLGGTTTHFTWDVATTPDLLGDGTTSYLYGPDGLPIEQIGSGATYWYLHDAEGSTRALLGSAGTVAGAYGYDAYGNVVGHTGTATTPLQYGGGYTDGESGLIYLRARYYDPATIQFLTIDPELDLTDQPYGYGSESPLDFTDPQGLWTGGVCVGGSITGVFGISISGCIVFDGHGNLGLAGTKSNSGEYGGTPAAGVSGGGQYSNANSIYGLGGPFYSAGASAEPFSEGPSAGANFSWGSDSRGCPVGVIDANAGLGVSFPPFGEAHGGVTDTGVVGFNVPGAAKKVWHGAEDAWNWVF